MCTIFTCCYLLTVYGVDLTTHVKLCSIKLPLVLRQCVMEVESRGVLLCYNMCVSVVCIVECECVVYWCNTWGKLSCLT